MLLNLVCICFFVAFAVFYVGLLIAYPIPMLFCSLLAYGWYMSNKGA